MRRSIAIFTLFILAIIFGCLDNRVSDSEVEAKALKMVQTLDSQSIRLLYEWGFGHRGEADIFVKTSDNADSGFYSYSCSFYNSTDSVKLSIGRFENFKKDFPCDILFDTSKYYRIDFTKFKDATVQISVMDNQGQTHIISEDNSVKELFPVNNPFEKFNYLFEFKKRLGFRGNFFRPDLGNFIQLYLSDQHVLTYFPDSLRIKLSARDEWMKHFSSGKTLSKNWNFRKLESPLDNG